MRCIVAASFLSLSSKLSIFFFVSLHEFWFCWRMRMRTLTLTNAQHLSTNTNEHEPKKKKKLCERTFFLFANDHFIYRLFVYTFKGIALYWDIGVYRTHSSRGWSSRSNLTKIPSTSHRRRIDGGIYLQWKLLYRSITNCFWFQSQSKRNQPKGELLLFR